MEKLLLIVEDVFQITNRGLVLVPELPRETFEEPRYSGASVAVRLDRPDGTRINTQAKLFWGHYSRVGYKWMCWLEELDKSIVPIGTKVWALEEPKNLPKSDLPSLNDPLRVPLAQYNDEKAITAFVLKHFGKLLAPETSELTHEEKRKWLLERYGDQIVIYRCPHCHRVLRTPTARMCFWCGTSFDENG